MADRLFPAMLKYWRDRRGFSQLDLALAADVSARHLSFLESSRARPSEEMVLRLMSALQVPLRDQNQVFRAAGFPARFDEPSADALDPAIDLALEQMLRQHEPFPMVVLGPDYEVLRQNRAARALFSSLLSDTKTLPARPDMLTMMFDPGLMRPFIVDWERYARQTVARLHRESLSGSERLAAVLERVLAFPGVPPEWRQPDFSRGSEPSLTFRVKRGTLELGFLVTVTVFSTPQQVTLDELRIESCFPLDAQTRRACEQLARSAAP